MNTDDEYDNVEDINDDCEYANMTKSTYGSLKKGSYAMLKKRPCEVLKITTSKVGKHGSAKAILQRCQF